MTTQVNGKTFTVMGEFVSVHDRITLNDWRELYSLGWHHSLGGVSVRNQFKETKVVFYGSGISDFSHVRLQIRKRDGKYEETEVKIDSPYWLEDGDTARVTNENEGKHVNLKITRERQASTQDRSRR